jgi:aminoglycoside phosphotransferase (APT) family kinase protein
MAGTVGVRIPGVWHAETGADGAFIMILEDLEAAGCTFRRGGGADPAERAAATVDALAGLHAHFWESTRFAGDWVWVPERAGFGAGGPRDPIAIAASAHFAQKALDAFGADMPPAFTAVAALYRDHTAEILDLFDEGPRTLIHGDPHEGNLFDDGPVAGFFDWAMFSRSPAVRDVSYHCASSLPTAVRREEEAALLRRYREALGSAGVTLDADTVERQYRLFSVFAWVSMASTAAMGSRWQPVEVGMEAMRRATAAVDDLDAVGVVTELLG